MLRLLFLLALVLSVAYLLKDLLSPKGRKAPTDSFDELREGSTDLVQDPICQLYIPKGEAIRKKVGGRTYYFCSGECANRFESG